VDHSFSTTETLNPYAASSNVVVDRSPRPPLNAVATEKMQVQFKMCLIANLVSVIMMFGSAIFFECFYLMWPPSTAITENFFSSWLDYAILFAKLASLLIGLPVFVIAIAGMLRFRSWARQLYSFLMIAGILQTVGLGIFNFRLAWGLAAIFGDFVILSSGAVLAMSYFSPLAILFSRTHAVPSVSGPVGVSIG
jgi:hypothetical protein